MTTSILIVEDEHRLREMMAYALEDEGYQVTQAPDGETAITLLRQKDAAQAPYAVVITDLVMENVDGIEVMNVARRLPEPPEVILLTGHGSLETAIAAVNQQAFAYLLKPCSPTKLRERVAAAVHHRDDHLRQKERSDAWGRVAAIVAQLQTQRSPAPNTTPAAPVDDTDTQAIEQAVSSAQLGETSRSPDRYLRVGLLGIDTYRHEVSFDGIQIHVTPIEYNILHRLATTPERVVPFSDIVAYTHGQHLERDEARELLVWHIRNLRQKFDHHYLVSVRGVGYMLVNPEK